MDRFWIRQAAVIVAVLLVVAFMYWPLGDGGFFWVDKIWLRDTTWIRQGDEWRQLILHAGGDYYWRPLVWALYVAEVRTFDGAPGPMHLVSTGIHLANTLIVGILASRLCAGRANFALREIQVPAAMLLYGLHPALIEPVAWITCQFDLVATFFMVAGLLLNLSLQHTAVRAVAVSMCFFLAACSKESAAMFPLLVLLLDWMCLEGEERGLAALRKIARTQSLAYGGMLIAGLAYLALRHLSLGYLVQPFSHEPLHWLQRFQEVCFIYLKYWRVMLWPMNELGPLHEIDIGQFSIVTVASLARDTAAISILACGSYFAWKRDPLGGVILAATIALLPVLRIAPLAFDPGLYHERYATTSIAIACALLPRAFSNTASRLEWFRRFVPLVAAIFTAWLFFAVLNIRVTIPLWADEIRMWHWVLREYPDSLMAKDQLLSTYLERENYVAARQLADQLVADDAPCPTCMLNVANLAIVQGDVARATVALEKAKNSRTLATQPRLVQSVIIASGQLEELKGNLPGAEEAYRGAIGIDPLNPNAQMSLALLYAREGRVTEARNQAEPALALFAPDERDSRRRIFEQAMAKSTGNADK